MPLASAQRGVALIEVLVSMLIFLIGVLGVIGLQARAVQFSVQAEDRSRAALLANDVVTAMWDQSTSSLPDDDLENWKKRVEDALPQGTGEVSTDAEGVVTVSIDWQPPGSKASDGKPAHSRYVTKVVLQ